MISNKGATKRSSSTTDPTVKSLAVVMQRKKRRRRWIKTATYGFLSVLSCTVLCAVADLLSMMFKDPDAQM